MRQRNSDSIHFQLIMEELRVSEATIRNWIKTGYLHPLSPSYICPHSYRGFKNNIVGTQKLHKRANKLHADTTDRDLISALFQEDIALIYNKDSNKTGEDLSFKYETELGRSHKNSEGIFYTPHNIAAELLSFVGLINDTTTFCDPCCGTGNFLIAALEAGIKPENIYGFDIDPTAIEIAQARIFEKTGFKSKNIQPMDFLESLSPESLPQFDLVFTNPPWGKKFSPGKKAYYASLYNEGITVDSSAIFSLACLKILKANGCLGLLLPEAFFNIAAYQSVRKKLLSYHIQHLIDYGRAFEGLQTRAQAIIIKNKKEDSSKTILCRFENNQYERNKDDFNSNPAYIYNLYASKSDASIIRHLYKSPHITLENKAKWALGIVTGDNKRFIKSSPLDNHIPVYKGSDIQKNTFKEPTNFIPNDFSLYQQVAPLDLYRAKEKIVYRFINSNLVFSYDNQQRFFLNSANMLILNENAGITAQQASFLLNTKIISWIFKKIFHTHKILRSDLEKLPLFTDYFNIHHAYSEETLYQYLGIEEDNGNFRITK